MLQLYDAAVSPCSMKVRLCLAEKGVAAEIVPVNLGTKANLEPAYLALNPKGVVPTLVDDGLPIVESTLINEYLDDRFPSPPLKPDAPAARVEMRKWTKYVDEELHPANGAVVWPILSLERLRQQDPDTVRSMLARHPDPKRVARQLQIFDQGYAAPEVGAGLRVFLSATEKWEADLAILPYANEVMNFGIDALADGKPNLHAWFDRMTARDSYKQAVLDVLPGRQREAIRERGTAAWDEMRKHLE